MNDETKMCRLVKVGVCCEAPDPKRRPFHAVVELEPGRTVNVHVSGAELLSYRRFKAEVMQQAKWLIFHEADAGGRAGRQAWDAAIDAAMKNNAATSPCQ